MALGLTSCAPHQLTTDAATDAAPPEVTASPDPSPSAPDTDPAPVGVGGGAHLHVAAGVNHTCALVDGEVLCWGANYLGQLGLGVTGDVVLQPTRVPGLPQVLELRSDYDFTCARTTSREVWCWGANAYGELGQGDTRARAQPTRVPGIQADELFVAYGGACARDGAQVQCWGRGSRGDGDRPQGSPPARAPALDGADALALTGAHGCRLDAGQVRCWGDNSSGQIGNGEGGCVYEHEPGPHCRCLPPKICKRVEAPTRVVELPAATQVVVGGSFSYARDAAGHVYQWGQQGVTMGEAPTPNYRPQIVEGIPPSVELAAGSGFACSRGEAGDVWCWGNNAFGTLGHAPGPWGGSEGPARVDGLPPVDELALGFYFACAVVRTGPEAGVWCWGDNGDGQLGDGSTERREIPVRGLLRPD